MMAAIDSITGLLKYLLIAVAGFIGILVGIVGFVCMVGGAAAGHWGLALLGVPILALGAWLQYDFGKDS